MQRVESFAALSALLAAQLKKGVVTNCFLDAKAWNAELENGLHVAEADGALWLLRERGGHDILNFYWHPGASPALPALEKPTVLELPWRAKDEETMLRTAEQFRALGFSELFRRARRTRAAAPAEDASEVFAAAEGQFAAVWAFLRENFSALTGCLPQEAALHAALAAGEVLCMEDGGGLAGLVHFARGRAASEIRHLAVRQDLRGQGLAGRLVRAYLARTGGGKSQVWTRAGYAAAEQVYERYDYRLDGWQSIVLQYKGDSQ